MPIGCIDELCCLSRVEGETPLLNKESAMSLNVLIVDDSATSRAVIMKSLEMAEIPTRTIFEAANGKEAITLLEDNWVDLVFADINMPVMGGVEMIGKLAEHDVLKMIPVIVVSTEGSATRIEELKRKGIAAYLRKPFTPEQLLQVVQQVVGEYHAN